ELLRELLALVEAHLAPGDPRPEELLVLGQLAGVEALPLALDDRDAAARVGGDGDEPGRRGELAARAALDAAAWRGRHAGAGPVEVRVEERVDRDRALV